MSIFLIPIVCFIIYQDFLLPLASFNSILRFSLLLTNFQKLRLFLCNINLTVYLIENEHTNPCSNNIEKTKLKL